MKDEGVSLGIEMMLDGDCIIHSRVDLVEEAWVGLLRKLREDPRWDPKPGRAYRFELSVTEAEWSDADWERDAEGA